MKRVLITGGTGCLGANLALQLISTGVHCRVLRRENSNLTALEGIDVEFVAGDVRDKQSIRKAVEGCDTVFHTAAFVSFWKGIREHQFEVYVGGTQNVAQACIEAGVERLVHTSSIAALGYRTNGRLIDEETAYNWGPDIGYKYSKHLGELEILKAVEKGLSAVIINPTVIIGPRDVYIHGGQFVRDIARRKVPAYLRGGLNAVSVQDVVKGHIAAAEHGRVGERYILGGANLTHKDFFEMISRGVGVAPPHLKAPIAIVKAVARICDLWGDMTGKQPWITSELTSGAGRNNWYSSDKAARELGHTISPIENAVRESFNWYKTHNML